MLFMSTEGGKSPNELWFGKVFTADYFQVLMRWDTCDRAWVSVRWHLKEKSVGS